MGISIVASKATYEPVSLDEIKHHLRVSTDSTKEDSLLKMYISGARANAENYIKRELTTATRKMFYDSFGGGALELHRPPISTDATDVSIEYINTTGATATVNATVYTVDYDSEPGRVYPAYDSEWPDTRNEDKAVRITYKCGYAQDACPESIKHWIRLRTADMYENRESITDVRTFRFDRSHVDGLLDGFMVYSIST